MGRGTLSRFFLGFGFVIVDWFEALLGLAWFWAQFVCLS
jgi:hypothetical protein